MGFSSDTKGEEMEKMKKIEYTEWKQEVMLTHSKHLAVVSITAMSETTRNTEYLNDLSKLCL